MEPRYIDIITHKYYSKFICPICGSSYFGSSQNIDGTMTRYCHGISCKFEWHDSQDEKYLFISYLDIQKLLNIIIND